MPQSPRVLITGASVAGPALAWGLAKRDWDVTLLERSAEPRETGQNIDIRGLGRDVVRRMGLEEAILADLTGEEGTRYVDERGIPFAVFPKEEGRDGPTAELEILRGHLASILLDIVPGAVRREFGDFIVGLTQDADGVDVTFDSGRQERFDLVLVTEGRSSRTRRLLFADATELRDHGVTITYGTIERRPEDGDTWDWFTATRGRVVSLRPDNVGTMRASLSFESEPSGYETLPVDAQLHMLTERFRGVGWVAPRILDGFHARPEEFYTQRMEQVVVSTWSRGRVALVGDAAWGSGPTGMGTTLALVGAHVLAGELNATPDDHRRAFTRYEGMLRGYADSAQGLPPGGARLLHPSSRAGVAGMRLAMKIAASQPMRRLFETRLLTSEKHVPVLPAYSELRA